MGGPMAAPANFVISERALDARTALVSAEGDTNPALAERLTRHVLTIVERDTPVVIVDLSGVTFVDSAVVHGLATVGHAAQQRGSGLIVVEPLDPKVATPFRLEPPREAIIVGTLEAAGRAAALPAEMLRTARPSSSPKPPPPAPTRPRRTVFGRRQLDQEVLGEMAQLRRSVEELEAELAEARARIRALEAGNGG
jgi:anti-anti-sigma regulatory factor